MHKECNADWSNMFMVNTASLEKIICVLVQLKHLENSVWLKLLKLRMNYV